MRAFLATLSATAALFASPALAQDLGCPDPSAEPAAVEQHKVVHTAGAPWEDRLDAAVRVVELCEAIYPASSALIVLREIGEATPDNAARNAIVTRGRPVFEAALKLAGPKAAVVEIFGDLTLLVESLPDLPPSGPIELGSMLGSRGVSAYLDAAWEAGSDADGRRAYRDVILALSRHADSLDEGRAAPFFAGRLRAQMERHAVMQSPQVPATWYEWLPKDGKEIERAYLCEARLRLDRDMAAADFRPNMEAGLKLQAQIKRLMLEGGWDEANIPSLMTTRRQEALDKMTAFRALGWGSEPAEAEADRARYEACKAWGLTLAF